MVLIIIAVCIYLPFISMANRMARQNEQKAALAAQSEESVVESRGQKVEV